MKFTKMHGCGNDYVYVNCMEKMLEDPDKVSRFVSDRHFGVGSDGLILICPSDQADFRMAMYNADGSEGEMCGNGIRCVAKFLFDNGMVQLFRKWRAGFRSAGWRRNRVKYKSALSEVVMHSFLLCQRLPW